MPFLSLIALLLSTFLLSPAHAADVIQSDLCIYGGTASGVAAAVQAQRQGKTAVIAEFGQHLGGMTSGGLGATDIGNKAAIGGIAREFYHRIALHYATDAAWRFETREDYFKSRAGRTTQAELNAPESTMWTFEPHVAEDILFQMLNEARVPVYFQQRLAAVTLQNGRITEIAMDNGKVYRAKMFIDATYEGDLMAKAKVSYTVGREANATYGETLNGIRAQTPKHQFLVPVDPYMKPGDPASGLLPFVQAEPPGTPGAGDRSVQAYNFRLCYTQNPANRLPLTPPAKYDPARYELLARYLEALTAAGQKLPLGAFWNPIWMPNGKTDINNNGGFSTDYIGANDDYPEADYATRARIWQEHADYTRGFIYFMATSPRVPEYLRHEMQQWGPAKDEFPDTAGWPHQLYVREARRMVSDYVMTEHNCRGQVQAEDPVGLAAYTMDSHNCRRIVKDGHAENEGDVQVGGFPPYPISYRSMVPKAGQCENLLVPVCHSATHIAYGSIRMEPVFMILGQSAASAAALAIEANTSVQKVDYPKLRARLLADKQILAWTNAVASRSRNLQAAPRQLKGIVVDDSQAQKTGNWVPSLNPQAARAGEGYVHDNNAAKGELSILFTPEIPADGDYEIVLLYAPHSNRATNVPVTIRIPGAAQPEIQRRVDQRKTDTDGFVSLGRFHLPKGRATTVTLSNKDTTGYVVADGVQFVPLP